MLATRTVLHVDDLTAVWLDGFRVYRTGFTLESWSLNRSLQSESTYPEWTAALDFPLDPGYDSVSFSAQVDGEEFNAFDGGMHNLGQRSGEGLSQARWWIPRVPRSRMRLSFAWPERGVDVHAELDADWTEQSRTDVIGR